MPDDRSSHIAPAGDVSPPSSEPNAAADDRRASAVDEGTAQADASGSERLSMAPAASAVHVDSQKTVISQRLPVSPPAFHRVASPFEMGETLEGEKLGHFQLEEFVGGGGMGAVFRATDTMLGRTVAVKVVSRDQTNDDALRRFKNEAQSAARLDHPNIARVYYVGEDKGWNYIVLEYIEGVNVRDLVEHNGPLALEDAISYMLQIAEALEHAAQRDVTHRDIKPSNILIMIDGRAKLVDMGLARLRQVESSTDDLTASGVTLGTFDYISPEQARDPRNTDVRSDLYSLGCTFYFMLTGLPPFPDGTVLQKLLSHSSDEPPDLRQYRPDVDEEVAQVVTRLLAKQPDQRYQSPRELIGALLMTADRLDLSGIRAKSTVWFTHGEQKSAWWVRHLPWAAAALLLLLFLLVYNWVVSASPNPPPTPPRLAAGSDSSATTTAMPPRTPEQPKEPADVSPPVKESTANFDRPDDASAGTANGTGNTPSKSTTNANAQAPTDQSSGSTLRDDEAVPAEKPTTAPTGSSVGPAAKEGPSVESEVRPDSSAPVASDAVPPNVSADGSEKTQLIVVTDQPLAADDEAIAVNSLEAALTQAAACTTSAEIELRFDGLRLLRPLIVDTDLLVDNRLTIRAASGSSPILAFRPLTDAGPTTASLAMVQILGGHVSWQGLHFYMELPAAAEPRESRSLMRLDTTDRTEFRKCTFTLRNVDLQGAASARRVAFVDVVGPGEYGGLLFNNRPLAGEAPAIRFENCIARGQAPLVRADFAVPFSLSWEHGLFVSTERLVEVGGTIFEPRWGHGGVNIFLKRLLSVADQGICLIRSDYVAPYQLNVSVKCDDCLFATQVTRPATPLYVVRTGSAIAQGSIPLNIHGNHNYYKNTQVVLRVETNGDRSVMEEYSFDDLTGPDPASWFNEVGPEPAPPTIFAWESPTRSVDRQTLGDFIAGTGDEWFTTALAVTPSQLPQLPDFSLLMLPPPEPAETAVPRNAASVPRRKSEVPKPSIDSDETTELPPW